MKKAGRKKALVKKSVVKAKLKSVKQALAKQTPTKKVPRKKETRSPVDGPFESVSFVVARPVARAASRKVLPQKRGVPLPGLTAEGVEMRRPSPKLGGIKRGIKKGKKSSVGLRAIIGNDDRQRVPDATQKPYPWICYLEFLTPNNIRMIGTGWLIGPKTVVTAGHCIYSRTKFDSNGNNVGVGVMKDYRVRAGVNAELGASQGTAGVEEMRTTQQWIDHGLPEFDFGVLYLDVPIGNTLGFFSIGKLKSGDVGTLVSVAGYPFDKQKISNGSMWADVNKVSEITALQIAYLNDTLPGDSGAPVVLADGTGAFTAVGIHNYGEATKNLATRITDEVAALLNVWKK